MDAFSLLYSKLLLAKLGLIGFGVTFAALNWQFLAYLVALFVTSVCWLLSARGSERKA